MTVTIMNLAIELKVNEGKNLFLGTDRNVAEIHPGLQPNNTNTFCLT